MIGDDIVVAFVLVIGLSFVGAIHYFWLRDASREETAALDGRGESERDKFPSVPNASSLNADCQNSQFAIRTSSSSKKMIASAWPQAATLARQASRG
jgi:hypothetical protein